MSLTNKISEYWNKLEKKYPPPKYVSKVKDMNFLDCLDENSSLEFISNNLGFAFIRAYKTKLDITFLNDKNIKEYNFKVDKKKI